MGVWSPARGEYELSIMAQSNVSWGMYTLIAAVVGHGNLLEKSPKDLPHAINGLRVVESARLCELRQQIGRSLNRTGHQLWEKAHEREELHNITGGFQLPAINVDAVAQRLESVEADAHRQYDVEQQTVGAAVQKEVRERGDKEVVVLEHTEDGQVQHYIRNMHDFRDRAVAMTFDEDAAAPAAERGEGNQEKKTPVPPTIKEVRDRNNNRFCARTLR